MQPKNIIVIGAGFSGISVATSLAQQGHNVTVLEKNATSGGRARSFTEQGFVFDMGPSWYWMPDVFDRYFQKFNRKTADYYQLTRLDPSYTVIFGADDFMAVPAGVPALKVLFESLEAGSGPKLDKFLKQAAYKYQVGINELVYKPGRSLSEFLDTKLLAGMLKLDVFQSMRTHVAKYFRHPKLVRLMEFPVLFLGALPEKTPALYSLMNYADMALGTWYPMGGMHKIIEGMVALAEEMGVTFKYNQSVEKIALENGRATGIKTASDYFQADLVVASADYNHVETSLLPESAQSYSQK